MFRLFPALLSVMGLAAQRVEYALQDPPPSLIGAGTRIYLTGSVNAGGGKHRSSGARAHRRWRKIRSAGRR